MPNLHFNTHKHCSSYQYFVAPQVFLFQQMNSMITMRNHNFVGQVHWDRLTQSFEIASMARYGNCRNLPLGSINHIDFSSKNKGGPFFSIFQIQNFWKFMWSNLYSFRNGGCSSRKNVITQSWWTNTDRITLACNTDPKLCFLENTDGWLQERKIFDRSFWNYFGNFMSSHHKHSLCK